MNESTSKLDLEFAPAAGESAEGGNLSVSLENPTPITSVNVSLPHTWDHIRQIRNRVSEALEHADPSLRAAAVMVTSELVENAVKYGEAVPAARQITVSLATGPSAIVIKVANGSADANAVGALARRVDEIMSAPDKSVLYLTRLEELMAEPTETGRLGLYRIAFEGQFDIHFNYANQVVTMTATRNYQ
jgi:hypothetical protein